MLHGVLHVTIEHNTALNTGNAFLVAGGNLNLLNTDFIFRDNIVSHANYGG